MKIVQRTKRHRPKKRKAKSADPRQKKENEMVNVGSNPRPWRY